MKTQQDNREVYQILVNNDEIVHKTIATVYDKFNAKLIVNAVNGYDKLFKVLDLLERSALLSEKATRNVGKKKRKRIFTDRGKEVIAGGMVVCVLIGWLWLLSM